VTCKTIAKTVKQHGRKRTVHVEKCTGKLVSGPVKFTASASSARATLARAGVVYATGTSASLGHGRSRLLLAERRPVGAGRYTLILARLHGTQWSTTSRQITIR
jgi:hypothetical protein